MGQDRLLEPNLIEKVGNSELKLLLASAFGEALLDLRADNLLRGRLHQPGPVHLIALGKAANSMAKAAFESLDVKSGIVISSSPTPWTCGELEFLVGGHPLPDESSLAAGRRLTAFAAGLPSGNQVVALLSGGASALAEVPGPGWTLELIRQETQKLMTGGADIEALNRWRHQTSLLKNGGLARLLGHCHTQAYVLSDVYGSDFAVIGSGPLWSGAAGIPHDLIGDTQTAQAVISAILVKRGFRVRGWPWIGGESRTEGQQFAEAALRLNHGEALVAGGEPIVTVMGSGVGGRAQEFALAAAIALKGTQGAAILAAGTDGRDGDTESAGAIVDGSSCDAFAADDLARSNSNAWAQRTGCAIQRFVSETNLNDLFLAVRQ